jgi:hypothetical protein
MQQGVNCTGVTYGYFGGSSLQCNLKARMEGSAYPGYEVDSAVRMSGPAGIAATSQMVVNGGFDGGTLSPWTSSTDRGSTTFTVINGAA